LFVPETTVTGKVSARRYTSSVARAVPTIYAKRAILATALVVIYKSVAEVEADFRSSKATDLNLRPIYHFTENPVRAHVLS
jgi:transposase